jgi:hypothetical protein
MKAMGKLGTPQEAQEEAGGLPQEGHENAEDLPRKAMRKPAVGGGRRESEQYFACCLIRQLAHMSSSPQNQAAL